MKRFMFPIVAALAVLYFAAAPKAQAQISVGVDIGPAPECPYGYYDYPPYPCAPYGYYGPEWFVGGVFIGAGPWFHGPGGFNGHVNNHFDPQHGYHGPMPGRGDKPDPKIAWTRFPISREMKSATDRDIPWAASTERKPQFTKNVEAQPALAAACDHLRGVLEAGFGDLCAG
jgi:hypothetical protein